MRSVVSRLLRRQTRRLKNRRGFALIIMVVMMGVMIGAAAFVVDFGRVYLFRAQLHSATDAGALAAAKSIMDGEMSSASDSAVAFANRQKVENTTVTIGPADVVPGTWTPGGGFVAVSDWGVTPITAVQVSARYSANYGFGRFFGINSHTTRSVSEAAVGYIGATTCVRPVAVPYQAMLDQLYGPGVKDPTYNLTDTDVVNLKAATESNAALLKAGDAADSPVSGSFYLLEMGPYMYADGTLADPGPTWQDPSSGSTYPTRFGGSCDFSPWSIGPGDWLKGKQGNAVGPAEAGFEQLCGISVTGNGEFACTSPIPVRSIKVAMWAEQNSTICSPRCYRVKYVGVWVVTHYVKSPGGDDGIKGYFSAMATDGAFSTVPGPLRKIALVR